MSWFAPEVGAKVKAIGFANVKYRALGFNWDEWMIGGPGEVAIGIAGAYNWSPEWNRHPEDFSCCAEGKGEQG